MSIYRRATIKLISAPLDVSRRRDEIFAIAQRQLEDVVERLTSRIAQRYWTIWTPSAGLGRASCMGWQRL